MFRFFNRFSRRGTALGRLEAFSDGVFAIIVTLLILEIKVPALKNVNDVHELKDKLLELLPSVLSWLISFIIVCKFWVNHSFILSLVKHSTYALVWINCIFLLCQSFIPFPTALMGEYHNNPLAVSFFGAVMGINTLLYLWLHWYINNNLVKEELADIQPKHIIVKSLIGVVLYLAGATMAWISIPGAFVMYFITPLFFITPLHKEIRSAD